MGRPVLTDEGIIKLLMQAMYPEPRKLAVHVPEGPQPYDTDQVVSEAYVARSPHVHVPTELLNVIPQATYHPQVRVAVDFSHQFTITDTGAQDVSARPVHPNTLENAVEKMYAFTLRYFNYLYSYGGTPPKKLIDEDGNLNISLNSLDIPAPSSELDRVLFLNDILNSFLSGVSVSRAVNDVGTSTIKLKGIKNPESSRGNFRLFYDSVQPIFSQLFVPMLPVKIWAKGRIYRDYWFPIFDGYITATTQSDSEGFVEYDIVAKDVLELSRFSVEMLRPALIQVGEDETRAKAFMQFLAKPFYKYSHFKIFRTLFMGSPLVYDSDVNEKITGVDTASARREVVDTKEVSSVPMQGLDDFVEIDGSTAGADEQAVTDALATATHDQAFTSEEQLRQVSHGRSGVNINGVQRKLIYWGHTLTPYRIFQFIAPDIFKSSFSTRLNIISDVAERMYFNFYVDGAGNVHYHPMRLSNLFLNVSAIYSPDSAKRGIPKAYPHTQVINNEETFTVSSSFNSDQMVTFMRVAGKPEINLSAAAEILGLVDGVSHKDFKKRFGYRRVEEENPLFTTNPEIANNKNFLNMFARLRMYYKNAELYTRTAEIAFRPEMELASPVLFTTDNNVFYVSAIEHNIVIGGNATTTVNGNFGRQDKQATPDLNNFLYASEKLYQAQDPKTIEDVLSYLSSQLEEWEAYMDENNVKLRELGDATPYDPIA